jgi:hypothetical protein
MYFNEHPIINYNGKEVVNIFTKIIPIDSVINNTVIFELYDIKDRETPELLSYKLYGSPDFHWVIIIINNIMNIHKDWPLSRHDFSTYVSEKYKEIGEHATHHYENEDGDIIDQGDVDASISNYTYEERINDKKSRIKILKKEYLNGFIKEFKQLL